MKIAVTGSYGAGKTTLAKSLSSKLELPYSSLPPMDSPLRKGEQLATECSRDELIELLIRRLMDRAVAELVSPDVVSDGLLTHDWVFVHTFLMNGAHPAKTAKSDTTWIIDSIEPTRRANISRMNGLCDLIVHLPIDFEMTTGSHPIAEKFRELSDEYLIKELQQNSLRFISVTGPPDERVQSLLNEINR